MTGSETLSSYLEALGGFPVYLAHNANIDAVREVDDDLAAALDPPAPETSSGSLDSPAQLSRRIADSMTEGEGNLEAMTEEFGAWLEQHLEPDDTQLGGQAAIMSDLMSVIGARPLLYTYLLTERQREMFGDPAAIDFPVVEDGEFQIRPMAEVENADRTKINWIFEFEEDDEFYDARAVTDSRFIAAARPERINLETGLENYADQLADAVDCALLSGIHSLKREYEDGTTFEDHIESGAAFVEQLSGRNDLPVQMEYGVTHKEGLRQAIIEEYLPAVDAVGMDSRELDMLVEDLGMADQLPEGESILDTYEKLDAVREAIGVDCVKVHRTHYFVAVTNGEYAHPQAIKRGWDFASIVAAAKASVGTITEQADLAAGLAVDRSADGRAAVAKLAGHLGVDDPDGAVATDRVVAVPNRVVADPKGTVGLGDSVAVANFALEHALADEF